MRRRQSFIRAHVLILLSSFHLFFFIYFFFLLSTFFVLFIFFLLPSTIHILFPTFHPSIPLRFIYPSLLHSALHSPFIHFLPFSLLFSIPIFPPPSHLPSFINAPSIAPSHLPFTLFLLFLFMLLPCSIHPPCLYKPPFYSPSFCFHPPFFYLPLLILFIISDPSYCLLL